MNNCITNNKHEFLLTSDELTPGKSTLSCLSAVVFELDGGLFVQFTIPRENSLQPAVYFSVSDGNVQASLMKTGGDTEADYELQNDGSWKLIQEQESTDEGT